MPALFINGTRDRQIPIEDAEKLSKATTKGKLLVIQDMDHLFKKK